MYARLIRRFAITFAALTVAGCALPPPSTDALNEPSGPDGVLSTNHAQLAVSEPTAAAHRKATLRQSIAGLLHPSLTLARVCMRSTHQDRAACNSPEAQASAAALLAAAGEHPSAVNDADASGAAAQDMSDERSALVSGKTPDVSDFHQVGNASWYGNAFHGRKTASGERYDMHELTAAHRFLPLFSYVRVTNALNHRSVVVKINDRGPFHSRRILDLSYAAAQALGMGHRGTEQVSITGLSANQARAELAGTTLASRGGDGA